jgi:hypothetical protein
VAGQEQEVGSYVNIPTEMSLPVPQRLENLPASERRFCFMENVNVIPTERIRLPVLKVFVLIKMPKMFFVITVISF